MMTRRQWLATVMCAIVLAAIACGGGKSLSTTSPTPSTPPPLLKEEITFTAQPVGTVSYPVPENHTPWVDTSVDAYVTLNRSLVSPRLEVSFQKDDGTRCAYALVGSSNLDPGQTVSGAFPGTVHYSARFFIYGPLSQQACGWPTFKTTKLRLALHSGADPADTTEIQQTFDYAFEVR